MRLKTYKKLCEIHSEAKRRSCACVCVFCAMFRWLGTLDTRPWLISLLKFAS